MIAPKFYHYRGKYGSDRDWIRKRMAVIPADRQQEVADQYETIFMDKTRGRKAANEYLQSVAAPYRNQMRARVA